MKPTQVLSESRRPVTQPSTESLGPVHHSLQYYSVYPRKKSAPEPRSMAKVQSAPLPPLTTPQPRTPVRPSFQRKFSNDDVLYCRRSLPSFFVANIPSPAPRKSVPSSSRSSRTLTLETDSNYYYGDLDLITALAQRLQFIINSRRSISGPCQRVSQDSTWTTDSNASNGHSALSSAPKRGSGYFGSQPPPRRNTYPINLPTQVAGYLCDLDKCLALAKSKAKPKPPTTEFVPSPLTQVPMPDRDTRKVATAGAPLPTIPPELAEALARAPSVNLNPQPLLPRQPSNMRFRKLPSVVPPPSSNQSSTTSLIGEMPTHPSESLTSLASPPPSAYGFMVNSSNPSIVNDNGNGIATPPLTGNPMTRKSDKNLFSLLRKSNTLTSDPRLVSPTNSDASPTFRNTGLSREPTMSSIRSRKSILPSLLSQTGSVHSAETASLSENNLGGHTMVRQTSSSSDHALEHQVTLRDVTLSCAHKGWLNKLTVTHSAIFARKSWRRRFFVLCGSALYRFKSGTPDSLSSETLGLTPESIVCVSDAFPGRRWVLEVTSLNIGTWFIQAEGKEDMKQWMSALKAAVGRIQYSSTRNLSHTVAGDTAVGSGGSRGAYFQPSPVSSSSGDRSGAELSGSENEEIADELQQNPLTPESVRGLLNDNIGSLSIMLYPGTNRRASQSSDSTAIMSPRLSWASRANSRLSGASHSNYSPVLPDLHQGAVSGPDGGSSQPRSYFDSMLYKHPLPTPAYTTTPTLPTPSSTGVPDFSPGLANGGYPNGVDTMTSSRTGGLSLNDRRPAPTTNPSSTALPIVREDLAD